MEELPPGTLLGSACSLLPKDCERHVDHATHLTIESGHVIRNSTHIAVIACRNGDEYAAVSDRNFVVVDEWFDPRIVDAFMEIEDARYAPVPTARRPADGVGAVLPQ